MKYVKVALLLFLHLACTLLVQYLLFRLLLQKSDSAIGEKLFCILPVMLACAADLILSCLLLKGIRIRRTPFIFVQFWDLLLICPVLILAILGFFSGGEGVSFGVITLVLDLLLIIERSTGFVLYDPLRAASDRDP